MQLIIIWQTKTIRFLLQQDGGGISCLRLFLGSICCGKYGEKGYDVGEIDEEILDATLSVAGAFGVGIADLFACGAERASYKLQRIGGNYIGRLNAQ